MLVNKVTYDLLLAVILFNLKGQYSYTIKWRYEAQSVSVRMTTPTCEHTQDAVADLTVAT